MTPNRRVAYIRWGGKTGHLSADINLGYAHSRNVPAYGIRRALWDSAFGYVNGFPLSAILYYALTRSLSRRLSVWAMKREGITFSVGQSGYLIPHAIVGPRLAQGGVIRGGETSTLVGRETGKPEQVIPLSSDRPSF